MLNNLGQTIRTYRKIKGYSTQELAYKINVSVGLLNNIENGKTDTFQLVLLNKIIDILEIPLEGLNIIDGAPPIPLVQSSENCITIKLKSCTELDDLTCKHLKSVIKAYLDTIQCSNFDKSKLPLINDHLINELEFLKALSDKPSK